MTPFSRGHGDSRQICFRVAQFCEERLGWRVADLRPAGEEAAEFEPGSLVLACHACGLLSDEASWDSWLGLEPSQFRCLSQNHIG